MFSMVFEWHGGVLPIVNGIPPSPIGLSSATATDPCNYGAVDSRDTILGCLRL